MHRPEEHCVISKRFPQFVLTALLAFSKIDVQIAKAALGSHQVASTGTVFRLFTNMFAYRIMRKLEAGFILLDQGSARLQDLSSVHMPFRRCNRFQHQLDTERLSGTQKPFESVLCHQAFRRGFGSLVMYFFRNIIVHDIHVSIQFLQLLAYACFIIK